MYDERIDIHEEISWKEYKKKVLTSDKEELEDKIYFIKDLSNQTQAINDLIKEIKLLKELLNKK